MVETCPLLMLQQGNDPKYTSKLDLKWKKQAIINAHVKKLSLQETKWS